MQNRIVALVIALLGLIGAALRVDAHAFLVRAEPRVGSKVNKAPSEVRVWFSEAVQTGASSIKVFDVNGKQVDKKDTHSDRANPAVLCISLIPALTAGSYKVVWRVTSMDTHVTDGNFRFQIVPIQPHLSLINDCPGLTLAAVDSKRSRNELASGIAIPFAGGAFRSVCIRR